MRVSITRGGGVAGLLRVTEVDADDVPADAAAVVRAAAAAGAAGPRRADEMSYAVRVGDDEARFTDSTLPEEIRALIAWVDAHPARSERIAPPG